MAICSIALDRAAGRVPNLAGKGHALIGPNEIPYEIGTGKVIYIPPHTLHNMKNTGTETLEYVFCVAPITEIKENEHE